MSFSTILCGLLHYVHYLEFHNGEFFEADIPLHFLCRGWMKDEGEWKQRTLQQEWASTYKPTDSSGRDIKKKKAVRPNSAPLYSATHITHLTSERTHFRKGSKVMYLPSWGWCVCSNGRVCANSVSAHIIYQQCLQYVRTSICQKGFPFASVAQSHIRRRQGGWQTTRHCRGMAKVHLH